MDKNKVNEFIDYMGLFFIGILSLGYLLFQTYFAKLHIYSSFIKAPIFVGEITFITCFCLFLLKWLINPKKIDAFTCLLLLYFAFVTVKTALGYFHWGPLSLRHSALFYYPLFALFGHSFYRVDFFKHDRNLLFAFILIFTLGFAAFYPYAVLTCFTLTLILTYTYPRKWVRYALYLLLLFVFPYGVLFNSSRTFIVANLSALVYMGSTIFVVANVKRAYKLILCLLFLFLVSYGALKISGSGELRSIVGFEELAKIYNEKKESLLIGEATFKKLNLRVRLYNEKRGALDQDQINKNVKSLFGIGGGAISEVPAKVAAPVPNKEIKETARIASSKVSAKAAAPVLNKEVAAAPVPNKEIKETARIASSKVSAKVAAPVLNKEVAAAPVPNKEVKVVPAKESQKFAEFPELEKWLDGEKVDGFKETQKVREAIRSIRDRGDDVNYGNSIFRIFIWEEVFEELKTNHPVFGVDFGKPFRSHAIEVLNWAGNEWKRDGWICLHNSYIDMIYRAGIIGILMIAVILGSIIFLTVISFRRRSLTGILLTGILIDWLVGANFLEILEMPYSAIPLWSLFGMTFAYLFKDRAV